MFASESHCPLCVRLSVWTADQASIEFMESGMYLDTEEIPADLEESWFAWALLNGVQE